MSRLREEAGIDPRAVVATGGLALLVGPLCRELTDIDPDLTLWGLALIHRRNR